jgi:hypothetical protein
MDMGVYTPSRNIDSIGDIVELIPTSFVKIEGSTVQVNATSPDEAKIALKELRLKKKEFGLIKRNFASEQKEIRVDYSNEVSTRGSKMRGGGGLGKFVRTIQTISRDIKRASTANKLTPLEQRKQEVEALIHTIDTVIIQVEAYILKNK